MIYWHVPNRGGLGVHSPLDRGGGPLSDGTLEADVVKMPSKARAGW